MKAGNIITIIPSNALREMRLEGLCNRKAIVNETYNLPDGTVKGCWVSLIGSPFKGEQEWYIPYSSIIE